MSVRETAVRRVDVAATVVFLMWPAQTHAQAVPEDRSRQALIAEALRERGRGDHARALELARRAEAMLATPSLLLFEALECQALHDMASAERYAARCLELTENDRSVEDRDHLLARCRGVREAAGSLTARIRLSFAPSPPDGAVVRVAQRRLDPTEWREPIGVNPGDVEIEADAPGYEHYRTALRVVSGVEHPVRIELRAETRVPNERPLVCVTPTPVRATPARSVWPLAMMIGGGALVAGGVVALVYGDLRQDERDMAVGNPTTYRQLSGEVGLWKMVGHLAVGAGGAAALGGLVWFLTERGRRSSPSAWTWSAGPLAGGGGFVTVGGAL